MTRTQITAFLIATALATPSHALQSFNESFSSPTLNSSLYTTMSSVGYSMGPLTPGSTWILTKQAGTTVGDAEIHTNFKLSGNFTIDLNVNASAIGTGEVGLRLGEKFVNPWAETFFQGSTYINSSNYSPGSYGLSGRNVSTPVQTLRLARTGDTLRYYTNGSLFFISSYLGEAPVTIFLRPYSGTGAFNPDLGESDTHIAVLNDFAITADAFVLVPEPSGLALMFVALAFGLLRHRPTRITQS